MARVPKSLLRRPKKMKSDTSGTGRLQSKTLQQLSQQRHALMAQRQKDLNGKHVVDV